MVLVVEWSSLLPFPSLSALSIKSQMFYPFASFASVSFVAFLSVLAPRARQSNITLGSEDKVNGTVTGMRHQTLINYALHTHLSTGRSSRPWRSGRTSRAFDEAGGEGVAIECCRQASITLLTFVALCVRVCVCVKSGKLKGQRLEKRKIRKEIRKLRKQSPPGGKSCGQQRLEIGKLDLES